MWRLQIPVTGITLFIRVILLEHHMTTTMTSKGQVTIPKPIRDALQLTPGSAVEFSVNEQGEVVLHSARHAGEQTTAPDRFDAVRGKADIKWRTDDLMALLPEVAVV
jgi:AbrB family looped-hinge helix DNA binding protein